MKAHLMNLPTSSFEWKEASPIPKWLYFVLSTFGNPSYHANHLLIVLVKPYISMESQHSCLYLSWLK